MKGNGTKTIAPNSKGIVNVVFRVASDGREGRETSGGGISFKGVVLLAEPNEIREILDLD